MLLGEVTSKQRSEGKRGLARQREEVAMVFHAQNILGLGAEVRSSMRKSGRWVRAPGGRVLPIALRSLDLVWRETES